LNKKRNTKMYDIEYYKTLNEKKEYFHCSPPIESEKEFDEIWDIVSSYKKGIGLIYRGMKNASYKIYSSAQREWNQNNVINYGIDFNDFILLAIQFARINLTTNKHFTENGISENNDLAYLSFLQHNYKPGKTHSTPLIDFTFNPFVALYFAFEESTGKKNGFETENYCSFYSVNLNYYLLSGYQNFFKAFVNRAKEKGNKLVYEAINLPPLYHIDTINDSFEIVNNQNINNQEGTFFVNTCEKFPLETKYKNDIDFAREDNRVPLNAPSQLFLCYDFNIKLKQYVLKRLKEEKGITENFIYPLKATETNDKKTTTG